MIRTGYTYLIVVALVALTSACKSNSPGPVSGIIDRSTAAASDPPAPSSSPPSIGGDPPRVATVGRTYIFQPQSSDRDNDRLLFGISNQPSWAYFDYSTGQLSGTPGSEHIGRYERITVSVTDGTHEESLRPFDIEVEPLGGLSVTLAWEPPRENEDGTALLDLAGYKIRYGQRRDNYPNIIEIRSPMVTSYAVGGLKAGTYYFVLSAFNSRGVESNFSDPARLKLF